MLTNRALKAHLATMPEDQLDRTVIVDADGKEMRVESIEDGELKSVANEAKNGSHAAKHASHGARR